MSTFLDLEADAVYVLERALEGGLLDDAYRSRPTIPASVLARRREVATILRRASEAGRFDDLLSPAWPNSWRDWVALEGRARELIDPEYEDVEVVARVYGYNRRPPGERVAFRVNGMDEDDLLGPRNGS